MAAQAKNWARLAFVACGLALAGHSVVLAQFGGQGGGGQGGGGQGGGGQGGGGQTAGVIVDADGVLRMKSVPDPRGMLTRQRIQAAQAALNPDIAKPSDLRKISITRLERVLSAQLAAGQRPTDEMRYLAGLLRVRYVFFYPETGDIVIAGPAEGWVEDLAGRVRGMTSGRPVVELQDLAVALRAFPPNDDRRQVGPIGCSIDPTQEGLARMQNFLRQLGSRATPNQTQFIVRGLRTSLGLQTVSILGVSPDTHFAQVMVEADYRMKLIGIGLERPPIKMASYVDNANPGQVSRNALQRWYFTPDYNCVRVAEDELAMELVGDGVKLIGEDELVGADGTRQQAAGGGNRASRLFVSGFTQKYPQLAQRSPVYAQLRNLIDLAVAAAFIQKYDYYGKAGWSMPVLGDEQQFAVETYQTPVQVETAVNSIWKGNHLMTPIGGGVEIHAERALDSPNLLEDEGAKVQRTRLELDLSKLAEGQWWWD